MSDKNLNLDIFNRVAGAYDLPLMAQSRVIVIGSGGSRDHVEQLARCGVGELVVVDPDTSSDTNIGTQFAYVSDIGRPKVEVISERLLDINPKLTVQTVAARVQELSITDLERLILRPFAGKAAPKQVLLALHTDDFETQAFGNRVALHFGIPTVSAQVYQQGFGGEVTFMHPETTPACNRCALAGRYRAYLEESYVNQVTSRGTPIWSTTAINALAGQVTMIVLHHKSDHPRWKNMLAMAGNRNLIQMRFAPDFTLPSFERVFAGADKGALFFGDTVWLPQEADHPETNGCPVCPDCGGTGDLHDAMGTFANDLYVMRQAKATSPLEAV
jgi:ThiF family